MTSRRNFLAAAAATGVVFCSCGLLDAAARAQGTTAGAGPRQAVAVSGRRVKTDA